MTKFYSDKNGDEEKCYPLKHFKELREGADKDLILAEMKPSYGDGTYYCVAFGECGCVSDGGCGSDCPEYEPRNGKNGRCKFSNSTYVQTGERFKLTENKKLVKMVSQ